MYLLWALRFKDSHEPMDILSMFVNGYTIKPTNIHTGLRLQRLKQNKGLLLKRKAFFPL